jgi:hypothetical protein
MEKRSKNLNEHKLLTSLFFLVYRPIFLPCFVSCNLTEKETLISHLEKKEILDRPKTLSEPPLNINEKR